MELSCHTWLIPFLPYSLHPSSDLQFASSPFLDYRSQVFKLIYTCSIPSPLLSILISSCSVLVTISLVFYALTVNPAFPNQFAILTILSQSPSHSSLLLPNHLRTRGVIVSSLIRLGWMLYLSPTPSLLGTGETGRWLILSSSAIYKILFLILLGDLTHPPPVRGFLV